MLGKKHNWKPVKDDYLAGKFATLEELALSHGIAPGYLRQKVAKNHWNNDILKVEQKTLDNLAMLNATKIMEANKRHEQLSKMLQSKGYRRLTEKVQVAVKVKDENGNMVDKIVEMTPEIKDEWLAVQAVKDGVDIERDVLGLNQTRQSGSVNNTLNIQQNFIEQVEEIVGEDKGLEKEIVDALDQVFRARGKKIRRS